MFIEKSKLKIVKISSPILSPYKHPRIDFMINNLNYRFASMSKVKGFAGWLDDYSYSTSLPCNIGLSINKVFDRKKEQFIECTWVVKLRAKIGNDDTERFFTFSGLLDKNSAETKASLEDVKEMLLSELGEFFESNFGIDPISEC